MQRQNVLPLIEEAAKKAAELVGVELIRVEYRRVKGQKESENQLIISICIHRDSGTAIKDCEEVSKKIEQYLDETDLIQERYFLEVASRGI